MSLTAPFGPLLLLGCQRMGKRWSLFNGRVVVHERQMNDGSLTNIEQSEMSDGPVFFPFLFSALGRIRTHHMHALSFLVMDYTQSA